ncbi:MAG: hypothetical protein ACRETD_02975, partial [Steroidobacteraceae bacterium]
GARLHSVHAANRALRHTPTPKASEPLRSGLSGPLRKGLALRRFLTFTVQRTTESSMKYAITAAVALAVVAIAYRVPAIKAVVFGA